MYFQEGFDIIPSSYNVIYYHDSDWFQLGANLWHEDGAPEREAAAF